MSLFPHMIFHQVLRHGYVEKIALSSGMVVDGLSGLSYSACFDNAPESCALDEACPCVQAMRIHRARIAKPKQSSDILVACLLMRTTLFKLASTI